MDNSMQNLQNNFLHKPRRVEPKGNFKKTEFLFIQCLSLITVLSFSFLIYAQLTDPDGLALESGILGVLANSVTWMAFAMFLRKFDGTRGMMNILIAMTFSYVATLILVLYTIIDYDSSLSGTASILSIVFAFIGGVLYFVAGVQMGKAESEFINLKTLGNAIISTIALRFLLGMGKHSTGMESGTIEWYITEALILLLEIVPLVVLAVIINNSRKILLDKKT